MRLCYRKHQRHRLAHEVISEPGHRHMSLVLWLKAVVKLRLQRNEPLTADSPVLVRKKKGGLVPMTGAFMASMDKV